MKRLFSFMMVMCLISMSALASKTVTGRVVSASDNEPLIGASVQAIGSNQGTGTDVNGEFSLTVNDNVKQLRVSYVGYQEQIVAVASNLTIALVEEDLTLDEVMVVAYGTTKKTSFTGSAQAVNNKKIETRPITSATKALEGNVGGIQIGGSSGQPGAAPVIRIRGFGSINADQNPLYVVDGIPYDGNLSDINPNDIESMTVLKDASASALYGARGANGVIMIQTKKGAEGKTNVTWRSTVGWSNRATKRYDNVDQKEMVQLTYEALRNQAHFANGNSWAASEEIARATLGKQLGGELYNPFKNYTWGEIIDPATGQVRADAQSVWNEDWLDAVTRKNAFRHEHVFSVNGGTAKTKYMFSLGYLKENGILKTTSFERYSARANVDSQIKDWFSANINTSLAHSTSNFSDYDDTATSNPWYTAQFINPLFPVYLKDAQGNSVYDGDGNIQYDWGENAQRPGNLNDFSSLGMLLLDKAYNKRDIAGLRTGLVFGSDLEKYGWRQGIKFSVNFGMDYSTRNRLFYMNSQHGNQANAGGLLYKYNYRTQSYTFNQLLTWNRSFGLHNIDFLLGHEWYAYKYNYLQAGKSNLVDGILELRPGTSLQAADSYQIDYRINSFLSRFNYNYDDRYYLSASLRSDASSRFHKDHHTGIFWSLGANWRVSKEAFMKDVDWIHNLSVKVSYGEQGNDNLGTYYAWQSLYDLEYANGNNIGAIIASLENREVTWEKNSNLNAGFEAALWGGRLRIDFEYFYKKTTDMLLNYPMALSTGFDGYYDNVGNMRNTGFELNIGATPIRTNDFEWNVNVMLNKTNNKVLKLTNESPEIISGIRVIKEGMPIYTYYMSKSAGVDPATGAQLYWAYDKDEAGNITREYVTDDYSTATKCKYYQGSRIPKLYGSIGTDLSWKGLSLSILTTYSLGGKIYDGLYESGMDLWYISSTWHKNQLRRWQKPGDITDVPRVEIGKSYAANDRFLIDASYFAIKNITLAYSLPKAWMNKIGIDAIKVFASADNVALFTHLNGMDPQYNFTGGTNYDYSPNKTYTIGLEVNF
ncbi:MAG: TonB-dependent receptor [Muribaculaceae bacterium]|nr:TonB-dependent receptor [Muribaculaceae bacterium]MBQ5408943.1 TonB-dependent receptor [Muribaculaceae bacterium]